MSTTPRSLASLLLSRPPPPLCPTAPHSPAHKSAIAALSAPPLVIAALHLVNDDIAACHDIVGGMDDDETGKYLHGVLHRREGDYWNSKYWIARTKHPLIPSKSKANQFVDACEIVGKGRSPDDKLEIAQWEELTTAVNWIIENKS